MKGSATITPSTGEDANKPGKNDVYLESGSDISVASTLAATDPVARVTVPDDKYQTTTRVLKGGAVSTEYRKFTVTPNGSELWEIDSNGFLKRQ